MVVDWTAHRFSGGVLALDTANTVVLRGDAARGFDRFDDRDEIARFAQAASRHRAAELAGRPLVVADPQAAAPVVLRLREAIDRLFRQSALTGATVTGDLHRLMAACADGLSVQDTLFGQAGLPFGDPSTPIALEAALAISALSLLPSGQSRRIRICANCRWLFLDASRNGSRLWCDMAVCGNRQKAKRHYRRKQTKGSEAIHG